MIYLSLSIRFCLLLRSGLGLFLAEAEEDLVSIVAILKGLGRFINSKCCRITKVLETHKCLLKHKIVDCESRKGKQVNFHRVRSVLVAI